MVCSSCHRANLPGGVRCSYCGTHFVAVPDFEISAGGGPAEPARVLPPVASMPVDPEQKRARGGFLGALLVLLIKGKSLLTLLKAGALFQTLGSMAVFVVYLCRIFTWKMALGLAVCILVHEMGHVLVLKRKGLKATAPMFIPGFGALISMRKFPDNPVAEGDIGAGGPIAGLLASVVCAVIGSLTGDIFWTALAKVSFVINLANMIPFWQLDGAHICAAFSPGAFDFALICLLLWVLKMPVDILWLVLVVGFVMRLGRSAHGRHEMAAPGGRVRMVVVFLGLCIALGYGAQHSGGASLPDMLKQFRASSQNTPASATDANAKATDRVAAEDKAGFSSDGAPDSDTNTTTASAGHSAPPGAVPPAPTTLDTRGMAPLASVFLRVVTVPAVVLWILGTLGWLLSGYFLARAAGGKMRRESWALAAGMSTALLLIEGCAIGLVLHAARPLQGLMVDSRTLGFMTMGLLHNPIRHALLLIAASFAGLAAAVVFTGHKAASAGSLPVRPPASALVWKCLGWTAAAALVVAYSADDWLVPAVVAAAAIVFYLCKPWLLLSLLARACEGMGQQDRSIRLREGALRRHPDRDGAAGLWNSIAQGYLKLDQGEACLHAVTSAEAEGLAPYPGAIRSVDWLLMKTAALNRMDRFDEALACCETMLRPPAADRAGLFRPLLVNMALSDMALLRGWPDEALARANGYLKMIKKGPAAEASKLYIAGRLQRARALASAGQPEAAEVECVEILRVRRDPTAEAIVALVRTELSLRTGDFAAAARQSALAIRLFPGSLWTRYWRGMALQAAGCSVEGKTLLQELANKFPREHWGRMAAHAISDTQPPHEGSASGVGPTG